LCLFADVSVIITKWISLRCENTPVNLPNLCYSWYRVRRFVYKWVLSRQLHYVDEVLLGLKYVLPVM
jgi:hypothetical protein